MAWGSRAEDGSERLWGCAAARAVIATDGRSQVSHRRTHTHRIENVADGDLYQLVDLHVLQNVDFYHTWLPTGTDAMVLSRGLVRKARVGIMDYLFSYRYRRLRYEQCT